MSILTTLMVLGFYSQADAGSPYFEPISFEKTFSPWKLSKKFGDVQKIEMNDYVDIPLYSSTSGKASLLTYVGTSADDLGSLFSIDPTLSIIVVTEGFAKENELEIKVTNKRLIPVPDDFRSGGEIKYVEIPELHVGGMILKDVTAFVEGSETKSIQGISNVSHSGPTIGLGVLDISYAVLESEGILRVTKTENGPELLKKSNATAIPYKDIPWSIGTVGTPSLTGKTQSIIPGISLIIPVTFDNNTEIHAVLSASSSVSVLDSYYPLEGSINKYSADVRSDWLTPNAGGTDLSSSYVQRVAMTSMVENDYPMAVLGGNILSNYDLYVDKSSQTLALVATDSRQRSSALEEELKRAKEALEAKTDEEENPEESGPNIGGIKKLISLLKKDNQVEATIEHYLVLLNDEEEKTDCALWLDYGDAQRQLGNIPVALEAYQESARLYHSWWDLDLHSRMDINKAQDKMKEDDIEGVKEKSNGQPINTVEDGWYISQPERCFVADGYTAYSQMLSGNHENVGQLYTDQLDLDDNLARALGNSALIINDTTLAHEAYRQAIRLEDSRNDRKLNRLGLALIYADQGKWQQANDLFQEAMSLNLEQHSLISQLWLDNARKFTGNDGALTLVDEWIAKNPTDGSAQIARLREYTLQLIEVNTQLASIGEGEETQSTSLEEQKATLEKSQAAALSEAEKFFNQLDPWKSKNNTEILSQRIQYLAYKGDITQAEKLLADTGERYNPDLQIASATVHALNGNEEEAISALQKSVLFAPENAGYSLFLK
jgi:hypothetical protein